VDVVDLNVQELPKDKNYRIVGITGMSVWKKQIREVAEQFPASTVIVGGSWATISPEEVLDSAFIDYACVGEGEEVWQNFLRNFPAVEGTKGIAYKNGAGEYCFVPNDHLITDFGMFPLPAWDLMKLDRYKRVGVFTSRGCPYKCVFCTTHRYVTRVWRGRKPESVLDELWILNRMLGVQDIIIAEDTPTQNRERFKAILEAIIKRGIKARFILGNARADHLTLDLLVLMKDAGFVHVCVSPESGSQRVLNEVIHKNLDLSTVEPLAKACKELGMWLQCYFVIGFPDETKTEIEETLAYAKHLRDLGAGTTVQNVRPIPGTQLYEESKANGCLRFDGEELWDILGDRIKFENIHCLSCRVVPAWTPQEVIRFREDEVRKGRREALRKRALSMESMRLLVRNPSYVLKVLRQSL